MQLNDSNAVIKIFGALLNDNELIESDQYPLNNDYFYEKLDIICYSSLFNLYQNGLREITIQHIIDFLQTYPEHLDFFTAQKGEGYLKHCKEQVELQNYSYYYDKVKKLALLRQYKLQGFDISPIYNENEQDIVKKQQMEERFNAAKPEEISDYFDRIITNINDKFIVGNRQPGVHAGYKLRELYKSFEIAPAMGLGLNGDILNTITRGARDQCLFLRSAASGVGKAIPNDTLIPTYNMGFKRVDEIKIGDLLIDQQGNPTKVLDVFPQKEKKQIYKISFFDDRIAYCCEDHLWTYMFRRQTTKTTESLKEILKKSNNFIKKYQDNQGEYLFKVPLNESINYESKNLSIDPYVFGLFLGDGSFRFDKTNKALSFSSATDELPNEIGKIMKWKVKKNPAKNYTYYFEYINNNTNHTNVWVEEFLKDYPDLINVTTKNKYIPSEYLFSSKEQRIELLRGLLDTDGTIDLQGRVRIDTISKQLAENIVLLCRSLGFLSNIDIDHRTNKYTTEICYIVRIQTEKHIKKELFKLKRKLDIAIEYSNSTKREESKNYNAIINIEALDQYVDMTCFTVDNKDGLFLMNDYIVTHNTRTLAGSGAQIGVGTYYDIFRKEWVTTNDPQPSLYITSEQQYPQIQSIILAFVSGVDEAIIQRQEGLRPNTEEVKRIEKAIELIEKSGLHIEPIGDYGVRDLIHLTKKYKQNKGIKYLFNFGTV